MVGIRPPLKKGSAVEGAALKVRSWSPLKKGDIVDVVSPGSASSPEAIDRARKFLLSWGLVPRIPAGMISPHILHSNDDEQRFSFLREALLAQDSAAVWCMRGGYGSNRLLPMLAKMKAPKRNKLFVGISDITSLHVFLQQQWGWRTMHGPILERLGRKAISPRNLAELRRLLFGEQEAIAFPKIKPLNEAAKRTKSLRAPIVGGNLVTLQSTIGTPWEVDLKGKLLFVEEIAERGYRLDRIFEHFQQAGILKGCRGVLVGDFVGGDEPDGRNFAQPVIRRWSQSLKIPVFAGIPAGHAEIQRPIPLGTMAVIKGRNHQQLTIPSGAL